jgi:hypothetical protein
MHILIIFSEANPAIRSIFSSRFSKRDKKDAATIRAKLISNLIFLN